MVTSRQQVERLLHQNLPQLRAQFHVSRIGIFGSYVRGEQTEDSDVDLLVEFSAPVGWEFIDLKSRLEEILGLRVDLVTVPALRPEFRDDVLNEVVYA